MSRLKKTLKWTGIALGGLVAIGLVANAVFVWTSDTRLERQLAAIRAAGDPLTLAELARPPIPPEKNAATCLRRAEAGVNAIYKEVEAVPHFWEWFETKGPMPVEIQKALKAVFLAYPDVIPLLQQAAACPDYDAQLDYTLPPGQFLDKMLSVQEIRADSRVLQFRVRLLIAEGNYDEALRTALMLFRLAQHQSRNPTIMSYLMAATIQGIAVDSANLVLQAGPVSKEVRGALDAELALQERTEGFAWALKSERAFTLDSFRTIIPGRNFWLIGRGVWNMQESACLEVFPTLIALTRDPGSYRDVEQTIEGKESVLAALLFPALKAAYVAVTQVRAEIRSLRVLNALQVHTPTEGDEVPKLGELGLPVETTTDPFNGEPLRVKKTPQGWLVYSVGKNLQDDGGKLDDYSDVGVGPPPSAEPAEK